MSDLTIDTKSVKKTIISFIKNIHKKTGFNKAIIGLSGGIDSSLSCYLAVEALGSENVIGIRMPYKTSSLDSLKDSQKIIDNTGIDSLIFSITNPVDSLSRRSITPVRKGNIMARVRMTILYDQSALLKGLVVGTGNKSESLLGYTTLYGDSACAYNPIGDLYKTEVRQLAEAMNIPQSIIDKPPSADLWTGQTDESELGFTYKKVDSLLYLLIEKSFSSKECIEKGFDKVFVEKIINLIHQSDFKRHLPPIAPIH